MQTTQDIINKIKDAGQALIDNADKIAGAYDAQTSLDIDISIPVANSELPAIIVRTEFIPKNSIARMSGNGNTITLKDK